MEKLQKALQKAREQRGVQSATTPRVPPITSRSGAQATSGTLDTFGGPAADDTAALWAELTPFEPDPKTLERNRIVTATAGRESTDFDILRTKILLTMRKNGWKRLAITSPTMSCGKTTTACNLAIGFGRSPDMRSILVEFDLRRPNVAKTLGLPAGKEISDMLEGRISFADQAVRYRDNVAIAAAHEATPDPTSMLLSRTTQATLQGIETDYTPDLMIFDLPPILVSDDTRAVLKDVDCAILIARADATKISQIDNCEREIAEHTNMLGVVLNQCRDHDEAQAYYE
jgi:protein-tyrosine kinase